MKTCPGCGTGNPDARTSCANCNRPLIEASESGPVGAMAPGPVTLDGFDSGPIITAGPVNLLTTPPPTTPAPPAPPAPRAQTPAPAATQPQKAAAPKPMAPKPQAPPTPAAPPAPKPPTASTAPAPPPPPRKLAPTAPPASNTGVPMVQPTGIAVPPPPAQPGQSSIPRLHRIGEVSGEDYTAPASPYAPYPRSAAPYAETAKANPLFIIAIVMSAVSLLFCVGSLSIVPLLMALFSPANTIAEKQQRTAAIILSGIGCIFFMVIFLRSCSS